MSKAPVTDTEPSNEDNGKADDMETTRGKMAGKTAGEDTAAEAPNPEDGKEASSNEAATAVMVSTSEASGEEGGSVTST